MSSILIIDDDYLTLNYLSKVLDRLGYEVITALNGNEGIERYSAKPVDVVITDIIMPKKEGVETIAEIKKKHPESKIIAISGGGRGCSSGYLQIAKMMGADFTLEKPFSKDELIQLISRLTSTC